MRSDDAGSRAAVRYHAAPAAMLRREPLDLLTLVYHRPSGLTHLLVEPAPEILDALGTEPLDRGTLLMRLADDYDLADVGAGAIDARLAELVAAGLVEAT